MLTVNEMNSEPKEAADFETIPPTTGSEMPKKWMKLLDQCTME